jgi:hypothetical protein
MDNGLIELIVKLLYGTLRKGQSARLHELLWTVDAHLHVIASADEINEALLRLPAVRVKHYGDQTEFVLDSTLSDLNITAEDIDRAFEIYKSQIAGWVTKQGKKKLK